MPYIDPNIRSDLIEKRMAATAGDLTFLVTTDLVNYWKRSPQNYAAIATIIGSVVCAGLEFYRRVAAPYEDTKIKENGDVY